jgi:prepilin-type N-terminal cleavage/methylation domain-containing protein
MLFIKRSMRSPKILSSQRGFTLAEVVATTAAVAILGATTMIGLLNAQKHAAATRVMNSARVVVQRNIDTALGVKFSSVDIPKILQITGSNGEVYNDTSPTFTGKVPIVVTSGSNTMVEGTLTRTVLSHTNSAYAVVRRITFKIDYTYQNRPFTYSITTLRAQDDQ